MHTWPKSRFVEMESEASVQRSGEQKILRIGFTILILYRRSQSFTNKSVCNATAALCTAVFWSVSKVEPVEAGTALGEGGGARRLLPGLGNPQIRNGYNGCDGGWCDVMMVVYFITI